MGILWGKKSEYGENWVRFHKLIVRNVNYIVLFKINDNISINNIIHNHNLNDIEKELFKKVYLLCTEVPLNLCY